MKIKKGRRGLVLSESRRKAARVEGFTLVEMLVVIVIIGILAAVVIANYGGITDDAAAKGTNAIIKTVAQQVEIFKLKHNRYPASLNDLLVMPSYVDPKTWPAGGYLTQPPVDGWGQELKYNLPGTEGFPYDIVSLGADMKEGGEGFDADIWNRARKQ